MEDGEPCLLDFKQPYQRKAELPLPHELPAKCGQFQPLLNRFSTDLSRPVSRRSFIRADVQAVIVRYIRKVRSHPLTVPVLYRRSSLHVCFTPFNQARPFSVVRPSVRCFREIQKNISDQRHAWCRSNPMAV